MVGLEHTIANFVMGRHLEDVEVIVFTPLHPEKNAVIVNFQYL